MVLQNENPAMKLHSLLEKAYDQSKGVMGTPFKNVWCNVFEIDNSNTSALLASLNSMFDLFFKTKTYIESNNRLNTERNKRFLNNIEAAIGFINFEGSMDTFNRHINNEILTALYYIGESISFVYDLQDNQLDNEQISELIKEIDILKDNISQSPLADDVILLLVKNLNLIRDSLFSYKISGIEGVRTALEQTVGSLFLNNKIVQPEAENEHVRDVFNIIDKVNNLLNTGTALKELLAPFTHFFLK